MTNAKANAFEVSLRRDGVVQLGRLSATMRNDGHGHRFKFKSNLIVSVACIARLQSNIKHCLGIIIIQ